MTKKSGLNSLIVGVGVIGLGGYLLIKDKLKKAGKDDSASAVTDFLLDILKAKPGMGIPSKEALVEDREQEAGKLDKPIIPPPLVISTKKVLEVVSPSRKKRLSEFLGGRKITVPKRIDIQEEITVQKLIKGDIKGAQASAGVQRAQKSRLLPTPTLGLVKSKKTVFTAIKKAKKPSIFSKAKSFFKKSKFFKRLGGR